MEYDNESDSAWDSVIQPANIKTVCDLLDKFGVKYTVDTNIQAVLDATQTNVNTTQAENTQPEAENTQLETADATAPATSE